MKLIYLWHNNLLNFTKSLFTSSVEVFTLYITENNEVAASNCLAFNKSPPMSFMYIRNRSGPNVEPCRSYTSTLAKKEAWLLSTPLCFLFLEKLNSKFKMLSDIPLCFSLKIMKSFQAMSNDLKFAMHLMVYGIFFAKENKAL